ncbi:MAG: hypothetical protein WCX82_01390 [archaeon]|jgi:hypothetical protein
MVVRKLTKGSFPNAKNIKSIKIGGRKFVAEKKQTADIKLEINKEKIKIISSLKKRLERGELKLTSADLMKLKAQGISLIELRKVIAPEYLLKTLSLKAFVKIYGQEDVVKAFNGISRLIFDAGLRETVYAIDPKYFKNEFSLKEIVNKLFKYGYKDVSQYRAPDMQSYMSQNGRYEVAKAWGLKNIIETFGIKETMVAMGRSESELRSLLNASDYDLGKAFPREY